MRFITFLINKFTLPSFIFNKTESKLKNGTPYCLKHGAMNKVSKLGVWKCCCDDDCNIYAIESKK